MPNVVNMVDRITPPLLNPESVSRYDRRHVVRHCHAVDTPHKMINHEIYFKLPALVNLVKYNTTLYYKIFFGLHLNDLSQTHVVFPAFSMT